MHDWQTIAFTASLLLTCGLPPIIDASTFLHQIDYANDSVTFDTTALVDIPENCIEYKVFTRINANGENIIIGDDNILKKSGFKSDYPTRIITHGYNGRGHDDACVGPKNAFLSKGNFNVIIMNWYPCQISGNALAHYVKVVKRVKPVALLLAKMIEYLITKGLNVTTTSLIGHSLGAHVVGIAGYSMRTKVYSVIGLDPAGPLFGTKKPGERISTEDAVHVEIIHSNAGRLGLNKVVGHYDFYPNNGTMQLGCNSNSCSHDRVHRYYTESITSSLGFYGKHCFDGGTIEKKECNGEYALMGGPYRTPIAPGTYFVETNEESPFAKGRTNP